MLSQTDLQKLRDLPIEGVAERLGLHVSRHTCLCPFHDDHHASLSFSTRRNTFRCWACGAKGDTIDLVMRHTGKTFPDACRWLADASCVSIVEAYPPAQGAKAHSFGEINLASSQAQPHSVAAPPKGGEPEPKPFDAGRYERFFEHPTLSPDAQRFLFDERRIDPRVARWCRLNSFGDWLQIPYYDRDGHLIGLQQRYLGHDASQPRFRFPAGSACRIYNLPVLTLLKPQEPLYITEGCSDCWAMLSAGHKAVAIPSATLLKPHDVQQLLTLHSELSTEFHMYPDRDAPGERLFLQLRQLLPTLEHHQLPPTCKDFADFYRLAAG